MKKKLIATDLSKQTKLKDPQQIDFIGRLLDLFGATIFLIIKKSQEITFNFSQNSVTIIKIMEQQCSLLLKNQKKLLLIFHKILPELYK